jgi:hypothetical protein
MLVTSLPAFAVFLLVINLCCVFFWSSAMRCVSAGAFVVLLLVHSLGFCWSPPRVFAGVLLSFRW